MTDTKGTNWNTIKGNTFTPTGGGAFYLDTIQYINKPVTYTLTLVDHAGLMSETSTTVYIPKLKPPVLQYKGTNVEQTSSVMFRESSQTLTFALVSQNQDIEGQSVEGATVYYTKTQTTTSSPSPTADSTFNINADGRWTIETWCEKADYDASEKVVYIIPVSSGIYVASTGNDDTGDGTEEKPFATLDRALQKVQDLSKDYTIYIKDTVTLTKEQYIELPRINAKSLTIRGEDSSATLTGRNGTRVLVITANANANAPKFFLKGLTIETGTNGMGITINSSADVDITGCTIKGNGSTTVSGVGLYINNKAHVILNDTTVSNFETSSTSGGAGICVDNEATLLMAGSTSVSDNKATANGACGGGILVRNKSKLYIGYTRDSSEATVKDDSFSGEITFNSANSGGGVALSGGATCLMSAGIIGKNNADDGDSSRADESGGGMYLEGIDTTFTMEGGVIADNECAGYGGGVAVHTSATFTMKGGTIGDSNARSVATESDCSNKANTGAGVYVLNATFSHTGGAIAHNYAKNYNIGGLVDASGGGVALSNSATYMIDDTNALVAYNGADKYGGGIFMTAADSGQKTCTLKNGSIKGNKADYHGGGIFIQDKNCSFSMVGGTIEGNEATRNGGAIFFDAGELSLTGGSIKDNKASTAGPGVYLDTSFSGDFTIGNNIEFLGHSSDIYFSNLATSATSYFTISENLTKHSSSNKINLKLRLPDPVAVTNSGKVIATNNTHINLSDCFDVTIDSNQGDGYWKLALDGDKYKLAMDINKVTVDQIQTVLRGSDAHETDDDLSQDILEHFYGPKTQRLFLQFSDSGSFIEFYTAFELVFDGEDHIAYSYSAFRNSTPYPPVNKTFTFDGDHIWCSVDFDGDKTDDISIHWDDVGKTIYIGEPIVKYYIFK
ncbi:MAG: hypothetical protein IJU92_00860 [Spirochaetaceae bacterium]|nr:hypothetical protein [Spirochaetaceae bacterium]